MFYFSRRALEMEERAIKFSRDLKSLPCERINANTLVLLKLLFVYKKSSCERGHKNYVRYKCLGILVPVRPPGRPRKRWLDVVMQELQIANGLTLLPERRNKNNNSFLRLWINPQPLRYSHSLVPDAHT